MQAASSLDGQAQPAESTSSYQQAAGNLSQPEQTAHPVRVVTRFLLTNAAAGSIIGRGGTQIQYYQNQTGARLQLSRALELFPGTPDRVIMLAGTSRQVSTALHLMLEELPGERGASESLAVTVGTAKQLRMLVPAALCGGLIGKGGATIRSFGETARTSITVSGRDMQPPVPDRIVRITGQLDNTGETGLLRAVNIITERLMQIPNYSRIIKNTEQPAPYRAVPSSGYPQESQEREPGPVGQVNVTVPVPDERVGAIIGKKGEVINQLKALCNVQIRISNRDDFVPSTRSRKVTIIGTPEAVGITQALIWQKVRTPQPPADS